MNGYTYILVVMTCNILPLLVFFMTISLYNSELHTHVTENKGRLFSSSATFAAPAVDSNIGAASHWYQDVQIAQNATIILKCPLASIGSSVVWMHSMEAPIDSSGNISHRLSRQLKLTEPSSSLLAIQVVSPIRQAGYYRCQSAAGTGQPSFNSIFRLNFVSRNRIGAQLVSVSLNNVKKLRETAVTAVVSSSVALPCGTMAIAGRIRWTLNGKSIVNRQLDADSSSKIGRNQLIIDSAQLEDSGLYTCWLVDSFDRPLTSVAQWHLLVLQFADADAAAVGVGLLGLDCSERLEDGSCVLTWSTVLRAAELVPRTFTAKEGGFGSSGEPRLRRSVAGVSATDSSTPHQLTNLRIVSETGQTVRVAWDRPELASCLRIELRIQPTKRHKSDSPLPSSSGGPVSATSASCSAAFADLSIRPGSIYRLSARIVGPDGRVSPTSKLHFSSPASVSSRSQATPSSLNVWSRYGVVHVAWQPPRSAVEVLDYTVAYRSTIAGNAEEHLLTVAGVQCRLRNLPPRRQFLVRVAARTAAGVGPFTDWLPIDTGVYRNAYLSSNSGDSPRSLTAPTEALADQLRIKDLLPLGKRDSILLSWTRPSRVQPDKYIISYGYHHPKERTAGVIAGDQDSYQIRNLEPDTRYFIVISAVKGNLHFETPIEARTLGSKDDPSYARQPPQVPMAVKVSQITSRNVSVAWTDPQLSTSDGLELGRRVYEVEWSFESAEQPQSQPQSPSSWSRNTSELSLKLVDLRPSTAYSVRVRCLAIASDRTAIPSEFSMRAVFSTRPEAPGTPPRDLKASRSTLPMSVMLSWLPPLEPNGKISKYNVLYRPLNSNSGGPSGSEHSTATAETQVVITGLKPSTHYYFRVRAGNSQGFGPDSDVIEFMMPDSSGQGGGVVHNTDSVLQRDSTDGADSDGLSSRRWWLLIGGVFGLALLLLATSTAVVCMCQQRRPRRSEQARAAAKESASLIGGPEQQQQAPPQSHQQSLQPPPGPGMLSTASPLSMPPTSSALLASHQLQHQLQQQHHQLQHQLQHQHQLHQQQQHTPDLCRHADFELRTMTDFAAVGGGRSGGGGGGGHAMMPMQLPPPPMLLESGPVPNPPVAGHFRNLSNSGSGSYQQQQQQQGGHRMGSVVSPPRVDAPDFSSPGKLSSPHSSLSSSIGSASKQRHAASAAVSSGGPLMSTSTHSRPYPAPDILNPAPGHRQHQLQEQHPHPQQQQHHPQQQQQLRNSHATIGSLTLESQNSRNFTLSTEDMDMTKTLDGLIQDLKGLTTREFEC